MLVLASLSPRRKELLSLIRNNFCVVDPCVDETLPDPMLPAKAVAYLSRIKAEAVAKTRPNDTVIAADTVVALDGQILGKPTSHEDAVRMLVFLSGKTHRVHTGVTILHQGRCKTFVSTTSVTFYPLSLEAIEAYVNTGEPMDKAGAYGIQGKGCVLVKSIRGDYFTVMGLPVARLAQELNTIL